MTELSRRRFLGLAGAAAAVGVAGPIVAREVTSVDAAVAPVVVVGGGMAGATVAKYVRLWSARTIPVTLIDANPDYTSSIMSNLVLNGQRTLSSLKFNWSTLKSTYGVNTLRGRVTAVNPATRTVTYTSTSGQSITIGYSRLVLAPGIDFLPIPGLTGTAANQAKVVHAWQAGPQTQSLRDQLVAMPVDGTFLLTIPKAPYRCPPGPYERACIVADWIKKNRRSTGYSKPQVYVLDANAGILAEPHNFSTAFNTIHAGVVSYVPNAAVVSVDADAGKIVTTAGDFTGNVLNVIPNHTAGKIARDAGLATAPAAGGGDVLPGECAHVRVDGGAGGARARGCVRDHAAEGRARGELRGQGVRGRAGAAAVVAGAPCGLRASDELGLLLTDHRHHRVVAIGRLPLRPRVADDEGGPRATGRGTRDHHR